MDSGGDKGGEEGVGVGRFAFEFGVELDSDEPGVVFEFDDFDQLLIAAGAGESHAVSFELLAVLVIEFVAMSVSFGDIESVVGCGGAASFGQSGGLGSESHGPAEVFDGLLFFEEADDWVFGIFMEFGGVGAWEADDIATEFDYGALHTEADTEEGDFAFAGVLDGLNFPFDATFAESAGDEDTVEAGEESFGTFFFDLSALDAGDADLGFVLDSSVVEGFVDGLVGIFVFGVFADDGDADFVFRIAEGMEDFAPGVEVGGLTAELKSFDDEFIEFAIAEADGDFVDGEIAIAFFDDGFDGDVAEEADFFAIILGDGLFAAADEDIGLDTDLAELTDGVLGRFGFEFAGGFEVGDEG